MRSTQFLGRVAAVAAMLLPPVVGGARGTHAAAIARRQPLDTTFGTSGFVEDAEVRAVMPDGRIVVSTGGHLARRLPDGTPDATFSTTLDGVVVVDRSDPTRIVVLDGTTHRLLASGAPDPSFTPFAWPDFPWVSRVVTDDSGRIVLAGLQLSPGPTAVFVRRLRSDGTPDPTFGGGLPVASAPYTDTTNDLSGLAVASNGAVAAVTSERPGSRADEAFSPQLLVWTDTGAPDARFPARFPLTATATGLALVASGPGSAITIASQTTAKQAVLARYLPDGRRDPTFGTEGRVVVDQDQITPEAIVTGPDGSTVIVGATPPVGTFSELPSARNSLVVARLAPDGTLDPTFASCGLVRPLRRGSQFVAPAAVQADGQMLVSVRMYDPSIPPTGRDRRFIVRVRAETDDTAGACGARYAPAPGGSRLLDTRRPGSTGKVPPDGRVDVRVLGRDDSLLTTGVSAVVLNITGTEADAAGFVTAWPAGTPRPVASVLNLAGQGDTAADLATVPVGRDGMVSLYAQSGTHLVVDLLGYYEPTGGFAFSGHLVPLAPQPIRVLDTRDATGPIGPDEVIFVPVAGIPGMPDPVDAPLAIIGNLTATDVESDGYVTTAEIVTHSNLNVSRGQTRANQVFATLGSSSRPATMLPLLSQARTQLVFDIQGFVARSGSLSELVAVSPTRVLDTRLPDAAHPRLRDGETITVQVVDRARYEPALVVEGVVATVTVVETSGPGFVTVWPRDTRPTVSNINIDAPGQVRPNQVVVPVDEQGRIRIYSQRAADIVVDVAGVIVDREEPAAPFG